MKKFATMTLAIMTLFLLMCLVCGHQFCYKPLKAENALLMSAQNGAEKIIGALCHQCNENFSQARFNVPSEEWVCIYQNEDGETWHHPAFIVLVD